MPRVLAATALLVGCAHPVPMMTTADPELCIPDATQVPSIVEPYRLSIGLCYPDACFIVDHRRGRILSREDALNGGNGPRERFDVARTETATTICDTLHPSAPCRTLQIPGVEDQQTIMPAISTDGFELYYVRREANQAFLDTIEIDPHARRLARVPLAIANPDDHLFDVTRVGSAVLVRDTIPSESGSDSQKLLVDPFSGAKRVVEGAEELDPETALVFEKRRATIVNTRGLATLAAYELPANPFPPSTGVDERLAAFAHGGPPTLVTIRKRAFDRTWRLPLCR